MSSRTRFPATLLLAALAAAPVAAQPFLYVSNAASGNVVLTSGGSTATYVAGLNTPTGLALDAGNNLYVADTGNNAVKGSDKTPWRVFCFLAGQPFLESGGPRHGTRPDAR